MAGRVPDREEDGYVPPCCFWHRLLSPLPPAHGIGGVLLEIRRPGMDQSIHHDRSVPATGLTAGTVLPNTPGDCLCSRSDSRRLRLGCWVRAPRPRRSLFAVGPVRGVHDVCRARPSRCAAARPGARRSPAMHGLDNRPAAPPPWCQRAAGRRASASRRRRPSSGLGDGQGVRGSGGPGDGQAGGRGGAVNPVPVTVAV